MPGASPQGRLDQTALVEAEVEETTRLPADCRGESAGGDAKGATRPVLPQNSGFSSTLMDLVVLQNPCHVNLRPST